MPIQPRTVHYVLSTHWDREWYEPFEHYRYRLVQLLDRVIDGLNDGRLKGPFTCDGQSIILDDYLEIRPHRGDEVRKLVKEGKLVAGPWYVLPDEFIVSGESIVRNIRRGRETARYYGAEPSDAGFVCDLFGHNSQLPQIFAGFGIRTGFIWRGTNLYGKRHALWTGADGTEVVCYRFPNHGYCNFAHAVRGASTFDRNLPREEILERLDEYIRREADETEIEPVMVFDGGDHQEWDQHAYPVLAERFGKETNGFVLKHSTLDEYGWEMLAQKDRIETRFKGELREPGLKPDHAPHHIPGVLSSRVWIKQQNAHCQTLLCHWAEPLGTFAHLATGVEFHQDFLNSAWQRLIQNHPHDSICGCSVDQVHEDMKFRFSQARQIGERLTEKAAFKIAAAVEGGPSGDEVRVVVFNPLSVPYEGTTELTLEIPEDYPFFQEYFGYERKPAFTLHGPDGEEIPYQRLDQKNRSVRTRLYDWKFAHWYHINAVRVSLPVSVPAMGYTTLTIRKGWQNHPTRYPEWHGLATSERSMENEFLAVRIENNGSVTLTDKRTGETYGDLLVFEDRADIGDGWFHGISVSDQIHASTAAPAQVALVHAGPHLTTFRIRTRMSIPEGFDFDSMRRAERFTDIVLDTHISLRPDSDVLEMETTVNNTADNHRMRVLFPTGCASDVYYTDTPFDVVERPVPPLKDYHEYMELEVEPRPMQSWCAISDGNRGLAVIATGLMEGCVRDMEHRPVALTLFRSTGRTVMTDGEPEGQLRQKMTFRYGVKPLAASIPRGELTRSGQRLAAGLHAAYLREADIENHRLDARLPLTHGFMETEGQPVLTSARMVEGALEVRFFNPEDSAAEAKLVLTSECLAFKEAEFVDFESRPTGEELPIRKGTVRIPFKPKQIRTVRLS